MATTMEAVGGRHLHRGRGVVGSKDYGGTSDQELCDNCLQTHVLEGVLSIELTDVAAENIWAPDDGEVLRRHPRPIGVQRHLVQVPHQEVDRPVVGGGESVENLSELLSSLPLGQLARQHQVGVEVVGDEGGGQGPEVELQHGGDAVDVVEEGGVSGQVRHPLIVEQVFDSLNI